MLKTFLPSKDAIRKMLPHYLAKYMGKAPEPDVPQSILACDFGKTKVMFLGLQKSGTQVVVDYFKKVSKPGDDAKIIEMLKEIAASADLAGRRLRLSVKGQGVVVRFIQFPKMKPEELKSALTFEAEKYIPFKADEVLIDYHILEEDIAAKNLNMLLVAVKKDEIYSLVKLFQAAGLEVELVDIDALAFYNGLEYFYPDNCKGSVAILDIGTEISTLIIARNNAPRFIRDISFGGTDLIKRLKRKLGLSDQEASEQIEVDREPNPASVEVLKEGIRSLVSDFKVSLDYYMDQNQTAEPVKKLFLGGGLGYLPLVLKTFNEDVGIEVHAMDIVGKVTLKEGLDKDVLSKNQSLLPVALGLALREL